MERVAFLLESTGERLGCLLNPESVQLSRSSGIQPRRSAGGLLTGVGLSDDPLLYTGGGSTELRLDLLFDVTLAGSTIETDDVRELTGPLWRLAENAPEGDSYGRPPLVRFVWGKSWNVPGVVAAVSERLEFFTTEGAPRRSWLRMRLLRVAEEPVEDPLTPPTAQSLELLPGLEEMSAGQVEVHEWIGGGETAGEGENDGATGERLDEIASEHYGEPSFWRLLAVFNNVADPLRIKAGEFLQLPPLSSFREKQ